MPSPKTHCQTRQTLYNPGLLPPFPPSPPLLFLLPPNIVGYVLDIDDEFVKLIPHDHAKMKPLNISMTNCGILTGTHNKLHNDFLTFVLILFLNK